MPNQLASSLLRFSVLVIILILGAVSAVAQLSTATITGVVQDTSNAVVPGATVTVTQAETNFTTHAVSGNNGVFSIPSLPVGPYSLSVAEQGFAPYEQTGIVLTVGQVANIQVTLKVGTAAEKITVTANANAVESTESTIQNTVEERVVTDLPLNGRNPASLLNTVAGVTDATLNIDPTTTTANLSAIKAPDASLPSASAPTTHGVRAGGTYFSLDGADNVDPYVVIGGPFPNPDATQEFSVVTGSYGARYVSAPGGAVNIITKSGTNQVHGSLFEFIRNGFFNAENDLLRTPDVLKRNQYGAAIGAPIMKDRWFIFGSYQGTRITNQLPLVTTVPTATERGGTFTTTLTDGTGLPGPDVVVPSFFQSTVTANALKVIPLPNGPNGQLAIGIPTASREEQFVVKSDFNAGKHRLFARYFYDHYTEPAQGALNNDVLMTRNGENHNWDSVAGGDTWVSGNWVADTRVSYLKAYILNVPAASNSAYTYAAFGAQDLTVGVHPGMGITAVGQLVAATPSFGTGPRSSLGFNEDVIYVKGKHQVSFGADVRFMSFSENNEAGQNGVFIFPGVTSSILFNTPTYRLNNAAAADFFLGSPFIAIQSDGFFTSSKGKLYGFYGEDKYRVTERLTVTAGLRWDPYLPFEPEHNHIDCFNPGQQSTVFTNASTGLIYPGDHGCSKGGTTTKLNVFQPRIGLAYQVDKKGNTAIRAGYGMYSMQFPLSSFLGFSASPWVRTIQLQQPFLNIANLWASAGIPTNPFAAGFNNGSYVPPSDIQFPTTPFSVGAIAQNFKPAYVQQWTLSLQHSLTNNDSFEVAYVGTKGTHLSQSYDANLPVYIPGLCDTPFGPQPCSTQANENARRPNAGIGQVKQLRSNSNSSYNGVDVTFRHRAKGGLGLNSAFNWSKCIDEGSNPASTGGVSAIGNDPSLRRGLCDFDQNRTWRNTVTWSTPTLSDANSAIRAVFGSWMASSLIVLDAGQPFSVATGFDASVSGVGLDLADLTGAPVYLNGRLNPAAFAPNSPNTFGNSGRNSFRSPKYTDVDLGLMKNISLTERWKVVFRSEAFNLFNHPSFFPPVSSLSSGVVAFGGPTGARDARILQFSLKVMF